MDYFDLFSRHIVCAASVCLPEWGRGEGGRDLLQARYFPFNFAKECVYIVINGGLVELNNSACAKCR